MSLYDMVDGLDRKLQLTQASTIEPLPVKWLWEHRVPVGEICLTCALGGVGKSTFHGWMIGQTTRGTLTGVHHGQPRAVIICAREDSWQRTIVPRLIATEADLDLVYRADVVTDGDRKLKLTLPEDIDALQSEITKHDVALVSLDPLLSAIDISIDSYKSREVREALEPLQDLADETGCSILANAHFNKTAGADPLLRIANSAAFGEVCRAALAFAHDPETGERVISQVKNNLGRTDLPNLAYRLEAVTIETKEGPSEVARLVFTGEAARGVRDILNPHHDPDRGDREIARDIIVDALKEGPKGWQEIAQALDPQNISERTGRRARDDLKKAKIIELIGGGGDPWRWLLVQPALYVAKWPSSPVQTDLLVQPLANQNVNGDAYLSNLSKEEEDIRENVKSNLADNSSESDLAKLVCAECGHETPGMHFYMCSKLPDPAP